MLKELIDYIDRQIMIFRCHQAKKLADQCHEINGKKHIVVLVGKRYLVMNNMDRKIINRKNHKSKRISFHEMINNAVYMTK